MPTLIIIRGNSGSGKTTLAEQLQSRFGSHRCLVLHQDVLRRNLLHANDHLGTPAVNLIADMIEYGADSFDLIIVEGILRRDVYGDMLRACQHSFPGSTLTYYLDVPFATCVKHNANCFSLDQQKRWWREHDVLTSADICLPYANSTRIISEVATLSYHAH